jgi:hypothetical protein
VRWPHRCPQSKLQDLVANGIGVPDNFCDGQVSARPIQDRHRLIPTVLKLDDTSALPTRILVPDSVHVLPRTQWYVAPFGGLAITQLQTISLRLACAAAAHG